MSECEVCQQYECPHFDPVDHRLVEWVLSLFHDQDSVTLTHGEIVEGKESG